MKKILIDAKWLFKGPVSGRVVVKNIIDQITKNHLEDYAFILLVDKNDKKNADYYSEKGYRIIRVWGKINMISNMFVVPFKLLQHKIDIAIFQNFTPIFSSYRKILYIHDIIYESHPEFFTLIERIYFKPVKWSAKIANHIVTISYNEKNRLVKYGYGTSEKISVVYNGVNRLNGDRKISSAEIKISNKLPKQYALYVGRINDRKNIINLIKSFEYVDESLKLIIVGKRDWKNSKLQEILSIGELNNRIIFTGYVSDAELKFMYQHAKLFVYVSYEEGFGLPPLEAMTFNLPVVVSAVSCLPEVCSDAAIYVDPDNPEDIARGITSLLRDEDLRNGKILRGLSQVDKFTWENSVKTLMNVIKTQV